MFHQKISNILIGEMAYP